MKVYLLWLSLAAVFVVGLGAYATVFPGERRASIASTPETVELGERLRAHVEALALEIGPRDSLAKVVEAGDYLERQLGRAGYDVVALDGGARVGTKTLVAELPGGKHAQEIVLVSAHYDSDARSPGAEANASGCAALLEIARELAGTSSERTLRFALFPDGRARGVAAAERASARYAKACRSAGEEFAAVLELDCVGNYDPKAAQSYPFPLGLAYGGRADFVGVVGSFGSRDLVSKTVELMRVHAGMGVEGLVLPELTPGLGSLDAAAFWGEGCPAAVITDTGAWRSARAGTASDTHDRLDYDGLARVTLGLARCASLLSRRQTLSL